MKITYPPARTVDQIDDFHGTPVADPYRWLEDVDAPETLDWVKAQNEITFGYLAGIPARERIRERLTELWDFPKAWAPMRRGKLYFEERNSGLQNQNVLYVMEQLDGEARVLLDPNTLSSDGTVALSGASVSHDGRWLAYATSSSGSDWMIWRIREVATGRDLPERIEWSKFSGAAWMNDGSGFFYSRYEAPKAGQEYQDANYYQKLYFHRVGTAQAEDVLVYERPDQKEWGFSAEVSHDGRWLLVVVWQGTDVRNRFFYMDLAGAREMIELIPDLEAGYAFVGNDGPVFYFRTDLDAPRGRLIAIDTAHPQKKKWRALISQNQAVLEGLIMVHDQFVALYMQDAHHIIRLFKRDGSPDGEISFPTLGSVVQVNNLGLSGGREDDELFYTFHSFIYPATVFRYDFKTRRSATLFQPPLRFEPAGYETRQVFVDGKDGTRVPMYLIHRKGLVSDGGNPALLYGYGGFNISLLPAFAVSRIAWLELGGVYAVTNLRGGGEYGEEWHQAGMLAKKQNVFNDFIACAEWLIRERITSTPKLAIMGGSNGGLLVGACMTQRPDLFGACIPQVGVMDMLRFHKFTIGWAWTSDYGSPDKPDEFKVLRAYSPYHNLKPGAHYPATLVTTADHDDRVVPGHSFKFAAALQAAQAGDAPTLIRIQTKAGHGFGKPTTVIIDELADIFAFLMRALNLPAD
jgi:prolyl oligopeptidase